MKNKFIIVLLFIFSIILISCNNSESNNENSKSDFNEEGFYFKEDIVFTKDDSIDLKDYIIVGDRIKDGKVIGSTTYDDLIFEVDSFSTNCLSVDEKGIVTKNNLGNGAIYVTVKDLDDMIYYSSYNSIIVIFGNDLTFSTWYGYNEYLDLWAENNNLTKGTIKLELHEDLTYKLTTTKGIFGFNNGKEANIEDGVVEGKITRTSSDLKLDYNTSFEMTMYYELNKESYAIVTSLNVDNTYYQFILFQEERII